MNYLPTGITADKYNRTLIINWNDGMKCEYSFTLLRNACPCAECKGGHENMGTAPEPEIYSLPEEDSPRTRLKKIEPTGTYGVTIEWEDGHHFGIYAWDYLRLLCEQAEEQKE